MTFFFQMCWVTLLGVQLGRNVDRTSHPPAVHTIASSGRASVEGNSELEKLSCKAWHLCWGSKWFFLRSWPWMQPVYCCVTETETVEFAYVCLVNACALLFNRLIWLDNNILTRFLRRAYWLSQEQTWSTFSKGWVSVFGIRFGGSVWLWGCCMCSVKYFPLVKKSL